MKSKLTLLSFAFLLTACAAPGPTRVATGSTSHQAANTPTGVPGVGEQQLAPAFWLAQLRQPQPLVLSDSEIVAQNTALVANDDSMHDVFALPARLPRQRVLGWIEGISVRPEKPRFDESGKLVSAKALDRLVHSLDLSAVPADQVTRFGLVVQRASLRSFPTQLRLFSSQGDTDIDRLQESALFPGTPVAIVHDSADGKWLFVVSPRYAAWIEAAHVAEGARAEVVDFVQRSATGRVVTGAKAFTVHTREEPRVSELQLDMGVRLPLKPIGVDGLVNGQHAYTAWPLEVPVRGADGRLAFSTALLQKTADSSPSYLPLTHANLITQAFKFLGERYGWGHSYNGRDCSGFVSEVYQSMGVLLPRNTSDQSISPAFKRTAFTESDGPDKRQAAIAALQVGDLIYIPGHVMMMLGRIDGRPYVIHDTNGGSVLDASGNLHSLRLNGVSVTPLDPMRFNATQTYIDRITNIVHIRR